MRILLLFSLILLLYSCTTVEVAKEITKATKSIGTSMNNIIQNSEKNQKELNSLDKNDKSQTIDSEIADLAIEIKEKEKEVKKQKKGTKINFVNKTPKEIELLIGEPELTRIDGNSKIVRFDSEFCRLFLFSDLNNQKDGIKYFEIRNKEGKLIINKENIQECYQNFKLT